MPSLNELFQSPRSGKFVSDILGHRENRHTQGIKFQSPRSGKFVSDMSI